MNTNAALLLFVFASVSHCATAMSAAVSSATISYSIQTFDVGVDPRYTRSTNVYERGDVSGESISFSAFESDYQAVSAPFALNPDTFLDAYATTATGGAEAHVNSLSLSMGSVTAEANARSGAHSPADSQYNQWNRGQSYASLELYLDDYYYAFGTGLDPLPLDKVKAVINIVWNLNAPANVYDEGGEATVGIWASCPGFSDPNVCAANEYWVSDGTSGAVTSGSLSIPVYAGATNVRVGMFASVSAYAVSTPVPEPKLYVMMLVGLGMISGVLHRRAKAGGVFRSS